MASHFVPVAGNIEVVDGYVTPIKCTIPSASRSYPAGTPVWSNGAYGVEPSGLPAVAAATVTAASTFTSVEAANAAFAPLFVGIVAQQAVPQSFANQAPFNAAGGTTVASQDASKPFVTVYPEGIARAPYFDGTNSTVTTQIEVGALVDLCGFANESSTGFYAPDGTLQKDTKSYLYCNSVQVTTTAANAIGVVCERALVGDSTVKFKFKSAVLNPASVL
jgi:hypothetical protein